MFSAEKGGGSMPGAKHINFKDLFKPEDGTIKEDKDLRDCKNKCIHVVIKEEYRLYFP